MAQGAKWALGRSNAVPVVLDLGGLAADQRARCARQRRRQTQEARQVITADKRHGSICRSEDCRGNEHPLGDVVGMGIEP